MNILSRGDLESLMTEHETACLSIYLPTERASAEIQQNPIRLKNLVRVAEQKLIDYGLPSAEVRELLEPARDLVNHENFWQYQSDGLAIFLSRNMTKTFRLPLKFEELVIVNDTFYVKPLIPLLMNNGRFFILALSKQKVRLFEGTRDSIDEIQLDNVPVSLAEAMRWDDPEESIQHRETYGLSIDGEMTGSYHGHGVGHDDEKTNILRYFQQIDRGLRDILAEERVPLVLAGVEYLFPIYRKANTYGNLIEQGIPGNSDELKPEELHVRAWEILEPTYKEEQKEAADRYLFLLNAGRATDDLTEIVPAACYERVDFLFLPKDKEIWGTFDQETGKVTIDEEPKPGNEELYDFAAVYTYLNGGRVFVVDLDELPTTEMAAAALRWEGET